MSGFGDLTPYAFARGQEGLNIGWLSRGHAFPTGPVDPALLDRLDLFCAAPVNRTKGQHFCEFCAGERSQEECWAAEEEIAASSAEIRAFGPEAVYCAPVLIRHYVAAHAYRPPHAFIAAVMDGPQPGEAAYAERLAACRAYAD